MDAQTGLAVYASRLSLARKFTLEASTVDAKKTKAKAQPKTKVQRTCRSQIAGSDLQPDALEAPRRRIPLGRAHSIYEWFDETAPATEAFRAIIDAFDASGLRWPSSSSQVEEFADGMLKVAKDVRNFKSSCGKAWLQGGCDPKHEYSVKHFVRMLLLLVEQSIPTAFDGMEFRTLSRWCPDEHDHAAPLVDYKCHQIRELFGCSALMWHCWACLLGFAAPTAVNNALKADIGQFWNVFLQHEATSTGSDDAFPPGPHVLIG